MIVSFSGPDGEEKEEEEEEEEKDEVKEDMAFLKTGPDFLRGRKKCLFFFPGFTKEKVISNNLLIIRHFSNKILYV